MKNWIVAGFALAMGAAVTATLLVVANPGRGQVDVYAAARDIPAGTVLTQELLHSVPVVIAHGASSLFSADQGPQLVGLRAGHDLAAGQLIQRSDVIPASAFADERLVFIPVKDAPPVAPGTRVDLLMVGGTAEQPAIVPFALGVEVRAVATGGLVVAVPSQKAAAFVYAAEVMRLVAVAAAPDSAPGAEGPIDAPDQAMAVVSQP